MPGRARRRRASDGLRRPRRRLAQPRVVARDQSRATDRGVPAGVVRLPALPGRRPVTGAHDRGPGAGGGGRCRPGRRHAGTDVRARRQRRGAGGLCPVGTPTARRTSGPRRRTAAQCTDRPRPGTRPRRPGARARARTAPVDRDTAAPGAPVPDHGTAAGAHISATHADTSTADTSGADNPAPASVRAARVASGYAASRAYPGRTGRIVQPDRPGAAAGAAFARRGTTHTGVARPGTARTGTACPGAIRPGVARAGTVPVDRPAPDHRGRDRRGGPPGTRPRAE